MSAALAFVDTETTGLDPDRHEIWEVGLIVDNVEYQWFLPVDLSRADPIALNIGRYHDRYVGKAGDSPDHWPSLDVFARDFVPDPDGYPFDEPGPGDAAR